MIPCLKDPVTKGKVPKKDDSVTFSAGGGSDFFAALRPFVCLKKAPKQTLLSPLTSQMLGIATNFMLKTSFTIPSTSVLHLTQVTIGGVGQDEKWSHFQRFFVTLPLALQ